MIGQRERQARGRRAELAVADYLFARGFEILGTNVRVGPLEIDVVARSGSLVVVVEVRTRGATSFVPALASLSAAKKARLVRAAEGLWQTQLSQMPGVERVRIDVAAVTFGPGPSGDASVEYFEAALAGGD